MRTLENALRRAGFMYVAGVDEVGRGCLAGPVVAAAVVLHPDRHIPGVCDSKVVPAVERERLYDDPFTLIDAEGPAGVFSDESQITELMDLIDSFGPSTRIQ